MKVVILVRVNFVGFVRLQTASLSTWTTRSITSYGATYRTTAINGDTVIAELSKWMTEGGRDWTNPDHAMLWTTLVSLFMFTRALLRLERTMNVLCHSREGGREGWREGWRGGEGE